MTPLLFNVLLFRFDGFACAVFFIDRIDEHIAHATDFEDGEKFEGDMDSTDEQLAAIFGDRNAIVGVNRWLNNTVPYVLSENHTREQIDHILYAMQKIENVSCVRFQKRSNETDYVQFEVCYFRIFL